VKKGRKKKLKKEEKKKAKKSEVVWEVKARPILSPLSEAVTHISCIFSIT